MATVTTEDLRNMTPLRVANHTVGKPDETLAMMEEDGSVYFRDVLAQGAVGRLRQRYMDVLVDWGVVDPGAREPIWKIGRAHVCTPVTNAHLVCRLLLETKKYRIRKSSRPYQHQTR